MQQRTLKDTPAAWSKKEEHKTGTFDAAFERLYWVQHPLNNEPSPTDDIDDWWTCADFGAFLINTYAQDGYEAAVSHLKRAEERTLKPIPERSKYSWWQQMTSLMDDYKKGQLRARLDRAVHIMRILTENDEVRSRTVITIRNVGEKTKLERGAIIKDWQHRFIAVNPDVSRPTRPGTHEVIGHQFIIKWPQNCHTIKAWQRSGTEWVLPQGYTFRLDEHKGGTSTAQIWTATAIPPKLISAEPPMQTLVKPQNVPKTTLEAIENMIKEDLESNLSPDSTLDEQKEEVGFAFEDAKTMMTSPRLAAAQLPKTFAYYPNIEDFFEPGQFYSFA